MTRKLWTGFILLLVAGAAWEANGLRAQTTEQVPSDSTAQWHGRAFLLALRGEGIVDESGGWSADNGLRTYAKAHPDASFLVFAQGGMLFRLDTPAELQRLAEMHEPLESLGALQAQLSRSMAPLSEQQSNLSAQMRATSHPKDMGRIGHEMGVIGQQQGVIGREQGVLGRAFYASTQELIDKCLTEKTCTAVGPAAPATARR